MYTGTAIRMAHALQLGSEFNQRHSPRQKEMQKGTFWACFVMGRLISYSNNRPLSIDMVSVRIQLPCPDNRFAFGEDYFGPSDVLCIRSIFHNSIYSTLLQLRLIQLQSMTVLGYLWIISIKGLLLLV
jgi:hypothetical protein